MITATFPPKICGVADYTFQLCKALSKHGLNIYVLTSPNDGTGSVDFAQWRIQTFSETEDWDFGTIRRLLKFIVKIQPDVVHIQYTPNSYGRKNMAINFLPAYLRRTKLKCQIVTMLHEFYTPYIYTPKGLIAGSCDRLKDSLLLAFSDSIIVTLENRKRYLSKLLPWKSKQIYAIPVGAGVGVYPVQSAEREKHRIALGIQRCSGVKPPNNEVLLGSFGLMHSDKRYEFLFQVLRILIDKGYSVKLLLIGDYSEEHPYYRMLQATVQTLGLSKHILWTGKCALQEISLNLSSLDIYVMTDIRGASARKSSLMSALAHGLPIVSSRGKDTTPDFVDNMILLDKDDTYGFVRHIERLIRAPEKRRSLGYSAGKLFEQRYSWEEIARQTMEVYRSCIPALCFKG